jgi:hypothetical protein
VRELPLSPRVGHLIGGPHVNKKSFFKGSIRVVALTVLLVCTGCLGPQDRTFRASVGPVLKQAADARTQLGVWATSREQLEAESSRVDAILARLHDAILALPQPKDRSLRYLAIRLSVYQASASEMVAARLNTLDALNNSTLPGLSEGAKRLADFWVQRRSTTQSEKERAFGIALSYLIASERVALGTSSMRDALEASYIAGAEHDGTTLGARDTVFAKTERLVRSEIATLH